MAKKVTIGSSVYSLATQGTPAGWGETESDLIEALIDAVNGFFGPGDILPISALIDNNALVAKSIPNLQFNTNTVRFAEINYTIIRVTDAPKTIYEVGKIFTLNDPTVTSGNPWSLNVQNVGGSGVTAENGISGVTFSINSSGQLQYISSDMEDEFGGNYLLTESRIAFSAKAIIKESLIN